MSEPISDLEYDQAVHHLSHAIVHLIMAQRILSRYAEAGLLGEAHDARLDRAEAEVCQLRQRIAKTNDLKRKLKQRSKRKMEIEAERKRLRN